MTLILASSSPRRAAYLEELRIPFRRVVPDVDESLQPDESPRRYVRRVAVDKAEKVMESHPGAWVLAADTTVVIDEEILGKPRDPRHARAMLRRLSGRAHRVLSGIALGRKQSGRIESAVSSTRVFFRELSEREIRWYVDTEEPLDKAGAYGAQGRGGLLVKRYEGSFSNVVGLPLEKLYDVWRACGLPLPGDGRLAQGKG